MHDLALSAANDGKTYNARVAFAKSMTDRQYRNYLLSLINEQARAHRRQFGQRFKPEEIPLATQELYDYMRSHVLELGDAST